MIGITADVNTVEAAEQLISAGFEPIPIPAGSKGPNSRGWETKTYKAAQFWNGQNIGVHLVNGLACSDLDCPEARQLAGRFLEPTRTSGRESTPDSHWWYRVRGDEPPYIKFTDIGSPETLLELRIGRGKQTVVAPSVHPSGERYTTNNNGHDLAEVEASEYERSMRLLAAAVLVSRHLPPAKNERTGEGGGRHDVAKHLTGYLLRNGLSVEDTVKVCLAAWDAAGYGADDRARSKAHKDIYDLASRAADRLATDKQTTGGRELKKLIPGLPEKLAQHLGWDRANMGGGRSAYTLTDAGNAERLVDSHGGLVRYVAAWGKWLVWDGSRWHLDSGATLIKLAQSTAREILRDASNEPDADRSQALAKWGYQSLNRTRLDNMIYLARAALEVSHDVLDSDPWLLNCENGTLDLRTGELRPHEPADFITKLAPVEYDPSAGADTWAAFLQTILPSETLRAFVQRLAGYALTGDTSEHILPFLYGTGANGKTTLINALMQTLGDYAQQAAPDLLLAKRGAHPTELADLFGMRFVASVEVEDGRRLAESLAKQLTGGDRVKARRMREDFWEFEPTHKIFLAANHKPIVRGTDHGIWRRVKLVPFTVTVPDNEQDKRLAEKLAAEAAGILAWAVRGCLEWQHDGLGEPNEVKAATKEYREEMDTVGAFLSEQTEDDQAAQVDSTTLYKAWSLWCEDNGERPGSQKNLTGRIKERGYTHKRLTSDPGRGRKGFIGLKLTEDSGGSY